MQKEPFSRLDGKNEIRKKILHYCRLKAGEIWHDPESGHRVGCLDCTDKSQIDSLFIDSDKAVLAVHDPPYNISVGSKNTRQLSSIKLERYLDFTEKWISICASHMKDSSHLYIWIGADQNNSFQPLPDIMILMREFPDFRSRSFLSLRNQRGYGTQKNWMCARQELLYYTKGKPTFNVEYTDIPKVLKGYYKNVNGKMTDNIERSKSDFIRPANVWIDIQQVFYRMKENVPGAYAQKPLKAISRIIRTSSSEKDLVSDFFSHSGTTIMACEIEKRRCFTAEIDPVFAELTIRRIENYRKTGLPGFQTDNPFPEISL